MMICVDNKMLHDALRDHGSRPPPAGARADGHGPRGNRRDGHGGPVTDGRHRREVLQRVVRISEALNQRLAL